MPINVKGLEIETGKLYDEYNERELSVLPPLDYGSSYHIRLGYDGQWYKDTSDD